MHGLLVLTLTSLIAGTRANPVNPLFSLASIGPNGLVEPHIKLQRRLQDGTCPEAPSGYTFYKDQGLKGRIVCNWKGGLTVDDLAQKCNADEACQSFNIYKGGTTDGDAYCLGSANSTLEALGPDNSAPGKCYGSYMSACPKTPLDYTFYLALDLAGNNIICQRLGNLTVAQLAAMCASTKSCLSFNIFKGPKDTSKKYCLKSSRDNQVNASSTTMTERCQGSYIADCPAADGYRFSPGMDIPGKTITCKTLGNLTVADVAQNCLSHTGCVTFTIFSSKSMTDAYCLKRATSGLVSARTTYMKKQCHGSYVEDCPATPRNYIFHRGMDVADPNVTCRPLGTLSLPTIALQCAYDTSCLSFSTKPDGRGGILYCLHSSAGPLVSRSSMYMTGRCFGSYVEGCPAAPKGWMFYKSRTLSGSPLGCWSTGNLTLQDLVKICARSKTCKSINTFKGSNADTYCLWDRMGPLSSLSKDNLDHSKCHGSYVSGPPPASSSWLSYWGGPIMATAANVYMIYVGGYQPDDLIPMTLNHFVENLGGSDWWRLNTRYYMDPPHVDARTYANGLIRLAGSYYVNGTADMGLVNNHTAKDVAQSIRAVINRGWVPWDADNGIYVIVSKPGQYVLRDCQPSPYCGWHTSWSLYNSDSQWSKLKFAFIPEVACGVCTVSPNNVGSSSYGPRTSPTGSGALDALVSTLAHELSETVTDPQIDAWTALLGDENADLCAWKFGTPSFYTYNNGKQVFYNAVVGQRPYLIQLNFDPTIKPGTNGTGQWGCVYGVNPSGTTMSLLNGPPLILT